MSDKFNLIEESIENIKSKNSNILFFVPPIFEPSASVYEIYLQATILKSKGYKACIMSDLSEYEIPSWIDKELTKLDVYTTEKSKIKIKNEDIVVIPESMTNVMESTKDLPCTRIVLLQSMDYMLNSLMPGVSIGNFGIKNVLTTSNTMKNLFIEFFGKQYDVTSYTPLIPDYFRSDDAETKKPVISIFGRNSNDISKIIKLFYSKYPHLSWVNFDSMTTNSATPKPLNRVEYAQRLKDNFVSICIDRIGSFSMFPIEAMKAKNIPISIIPDIVPEYLFDTDNDGNEIQINNAGCWVDSIYKIPSVLASLIHAFLEYGDLSSYYEDMDKVSSKFTFSRTENEIVEYYTAILSRKQETLENIINSNDKENE